MMSENTSRNRTRSISHVSVTNTVYLNVVNSVEPLCNKRLFLKNLYLTKFSFNLDFENIYIHTNRKKHLNNEQEYHFKEFISDQIF